VRKSTAQALASAGYIATKHNAIRR
jgi:hypothetical protein